MKLEKKIAQLLASYEFPEGSTFDVIAHELTNDGHGWSVNDSWRIEKDVTAEEIPGIARGRWETFKANYAKRARVQDLKAQDYGETEMGLECDFLAFLTIRLREKEESKELPAPPAEIQIPAGWETAETSVED